MCPNLAIVAGQHAEVRDHDMRCLAPHRENTRGPAGPRTSKPKNLSAPKSLDMPCEGTYALLHMAKAKPGPSSLPPGGAPFWLGGPGIPETCGGGLTSALFVARLLGFEFGSKDQNSGVGEGLLGTGMFCHSRSTKASYQARSGLRPHACSQVDMHVSSCVESVLVLLVLPVYFVSWFRAPGEGRP